MNRCSNITLPIIFLSISTSILPMDVSSSHGGSIKKENIRNQIYSAYDEAERELGSRTFKDNETFESVFTNKVNGITDNAIEIIKNHQRELESKMKSSKQAFWSKSLARGACVATGILGYSYYRSKQDNTIEANHLKKAALSTANKIFPSQMDFINKVYSAKNSIYLAYEYSITVNPITLISVAGVISVIGYATKYAYQNYSQYLSSICHKYIPSWMWSMRDLIMGPGEYAYNQFSKTWNYKSRLKKRYERNQKILNILKRRKIKRRHSV